MCTLLYYDEWQANRVFMGRTCYPNPTWVTAVHPQLLGEGGGTRCLANLHNSRIIPECLNGHYLQCSCDHQFVFASPTQLLRKISSPHGADTQELSLGHGQREPSWQGGLASPWRPWHLNCEWAAAQWARVTQHHAILTQRFRFPCVPPWPSSPWHPWERDHPLPGRRRPPVGGWQAWSGSVLSGTHCCPPVKGVPVITLLTIPLWQLLFNTELS